MAERRNSESATLPCTTTISFAILPPPPSIPSFIDDIIVKAEESAVTNSAPQARRGEIVRCDIMWSASSSNHSEQFTPVQSCDIQPIVIVRDSDLRITFDDDDIEERQSALRIHYRWRRGPARAVCFFHPHRVATKQCAITLRCFCSDHCFRRGFKQLKRFYTSMGKLPIPRQINQFSYGVPCKSHISYEHIREPDIAHYKLLRQAGLVVDPEKEEWIVVSYSRNFAPSKEDVGHQLKFECVVVCASETANGVTAFSPRPPTNRVASCEATSPDRPGAPDSGPRSSPVALLRKAPSPNLIHVDWNAEETFWTTWDKAEGNNINHPPDTPTYKSVITCCVVPQAPVVDTRPINPVGVLACMTQSSTQGGVCSFKQRIIPPGSVLAKALGIGVFSLRGRPRYKPDMDPVWSVRMVSAPQAPSIREQREDVLTDRLFAQWTGQPTSDKAEASPSPGADSRLLNKPSRPLLQYNYNHMETQDGFTVMTWNVLADIYATMEAYPYAEPYTLAWSYRRDRILAEVLAYRPDIICLQEVQADHFEDFFAPALLRRGYEGLYKQKTSKLFRGSGKHRGGRYVCDGCATFFKAPKFRLVDHFGIEFARVAPRVPEKTDKRLNKDNVALVLCLEQVLTRSSNTGGASKMKSVTQATRAAPTRSESTDPVPNGQVGSGSVRTLVVANTHILANPEAPDVKIWQANTLTSVLTEYMEKTMLTFTRLDGGSRLPGLVVCGDFNSTPDSAVYQLVTAGTCDSRHAELQSSEIYKWLHDVRLGHGLNLKSSYGAAAFIRAEAERAFNSAGSTASGGSSQVNGVRSNGLATTSGTSFAHFEPEFTNYTHTYVGCLDYIFFDDRALRVTGTLELLQELTLMEEAYRLQLSDWALPSPQRSSDHTALLSQFEWTR
eukprot:Blabericola_migrator_1__12028@NODE_739_length_6686_cov_203_338118_g530_i0_p1_GENE_NODE_739_length_6686_cov_203_338118_g530_i0NODE_739_length_6686_cov_203_338118_g530_i0_p1_ORF_typecomplete_len897_score123_82Exo_endo_phos/PF03372_23/3_6e47_NODE_739_length_6686_cov_203_338118_g530_i036266316